ncbi:MAG: hypothetical protein MPW16_14820 [Candidatus Manganitrophus sp.]|nr:MAG: hypothetical protein MPW16_14820 [Candidatus Manganitrophus sp.]
MKAAEKQLPDAGGDLLVGASPRQPLVDLPSHEKRSPIAQPARAPPSAETLEDRLAILGRNSGTALPHLQNDPPLLLPDRHPDPAAGGGKFKCVRQQIAENSPPLSGAPRAVSASGVSTV